MKKSLLVSILALCALPARAQVSVLTYKSDNLRSGQNLNEVTLTSTNVNSSTFGKVYSLAVDGYVYAQPLFYSNLAIPGRGSRNVVSKDHTVGSAHQIAELADGIAESLGWPV